MAGQQQLSGCGKCCGSLGCHHHQHSTTGHGHCGCGDHQAIAVDQCHHLPSAIWPAQTWPQPSTFTMHTKCYMPTPLLSGHRQLNPFTSGANTRSDRYADIFISKQVFEEYLNENRWFNLVWQYLYKYFSETALIEKLGSKLPDHVHIQAARWKYHSYKCNFKEVFEGEMLTRNYNLDSLFQTSYQCMLNLKVIFKSITGPDDPCQAISCMCGLTYQNLCQAKS